MHNSPRVPPPEITALIDEFRLRARLVVREQFGGTSISEAAATLDEGNARERLDRALAGDAEVVNAVRAWAKTLLVGGDEAASRAAVLHAFAARTTPSEARHE